VTTAKGLAGEIRKGLGLRHGGSGLAELVDRTRTWPAVAHLARSSSRDCGGREQ
jgi:hypothetical protein